MKEVPVLDLKNLSSLEGKGKNLSVNVLRPITKNFMQREKQRRLEQILQGEKSQ
jgi:hypothetical protein